MADASGAMRRSPRPGRDDLAEIIIPAAQSGRGATNTGGPVSPDDQAVSSRVSSQARDDLDRALWQGRTLRGLADAASPQTRRELVDTIIAAGWRPPLPDGETEWGWRSRRNPGLIMAPLTEERARRSANTAADVEAVCREVGPWRAVQP